MQQVAKLKNVQLRTRRYTYKGLINTVRCIYGYAYVCVRIYIHVRYEWRRPGDLFGTLSLSPSPLCVCVWNCRERKRDEEGPPWDLLNLHLLLYCYYGDLFPIFGGKLHWSLPTNADFSKGVYEISLTSFYFRKY